jgi:hypothetical protein
MTLDNGIVFPMSGRQWRYWVTSARSMAMLVPELAPLRCPVFTIVTVCDPAARTGLVHTIPEALRAGA